ncbi:hypothetical protein ACHAPJ_010982 [Fusarium lateritium]
MNYRMDPYAYEDWELEELKAEAGLKYVSVRAQATMLIKTMPNLEVIDWEDRFPMNESMLQLLSRTKAHDLSLGSAMIYEPYSQWFSLVVTHLPTEEERSEHVATFIKQHKHIQKLFISETPEAIDRIAHLDRVIIPALETGGFNNLRSLFLGWGRGQIYAPHPEGLDFPNLEVDSIDISEEALATVSNITSLEQLGLRCGDEFQRSYDDPDDDKYHWLIDHNKLRARLGNLQRLKKLAIVRLLEQKDAKGRPELNADEEENSPSIRTWERAHRNRMLTQAEVYAAILPNLEWMFCGQRPISFCRSPGKPIRALPLTAGRDERITYIRTTFGIERKDI